MIFTDSQKIFFFVNNQKMKNLRVHKLTKMC